MKKEVDMSGLHLMIDARHGIYVPQLFAKEIFFDKWGFKDDDEDIKIISEGPENEFYWEAWQSVLDRAELVNAFGKKFRLYQDGDLWAYCEELMTEQERKDFFGEQ